MYFNLLKMKDRGAQIQIGETVAVLFVFFILIIIGFIFYAKVLKDNLEVERDEISQLKSIGIAQRVMFLPELQCSDDIVKEVSDCIDRLKIEIAQDLMKKNEIDYYDLFEFAEINITQIYPIEMKHTIYSRKKENYRNKFVTNVPVSIYHPLTKKYGFGILTIETLT